MMVIKIGLAVKIEGWHSLFGLNRVSTDASDRGI